MYVSKYKYIYIYIFWIALLLLYLHFAWGSNLEDQKPSDHPQQLHDTTIQAKIITTLQQETVPAPILSFLRCGTTRVPVFLHRWYSNDEKSLQVFRVYIYIYIFFALFFPVTAWSTKNQPHQQVGTSLFRIPKNIPSDPDPIHPSKAAKSNFLGFVLVDRSCTWKIQWLNVNVSPN